MNKKPELSLILEAAILASGKPLSIDHLANLFPEEERPDGNEIREALVAISEACENRGFELKQVASGFRFQVRQALAPWIGKLWEEKPPRYTRALLETLALIAYRQPITRGEIEEVRGVSVSSNIIRTLQEREWVRVVGHRDVPGRPAMFATTRQFLDYFNLVNLSELPPLSEIRDLEAAARKLQDQALAEDTEIPSETLSHDEQEEAEELSARELFDELDAMEAELPEGFDDMIKKKKVDRIKMEPEPAPIIESNALTEDEDNTDREPSDSDQAPDESLH